MGNNGKMGRNSKLKVTVDQDGAECVIWLDGRLDSLTSPELEEKLEDVLEGLEKLIFDVGKLEYISSAGLRVLLGAAQVMEENGEMIIRNLTPVVKEVFDVTGFIDAFNIE